VREENLFSRAGSLCAPLSSSHSFASAAGRLRNIQS
jgi:hypothetical protein